MTHKVETLSNTSFFSSYNNKQGIKIRWLEIPLLRRRSSHSGNRLLSRRRRGANENRRNLILQQPWCPALIFHWTPLNKITIQLYIQIPFCFFFSESNKNRRIKISFAIKRWTFILREIKGWTFELPKNWKWKCNFRERGYI